MNNEQIRDEFERKFPGLSETYTYQEVAEFFLTHHRQAFEKVEKEIEDKLTHKEDYDLVRGAKYLNKVFAAGYNKGVRDAEKLVLDALAIIREEI